jgi:hypothetical protein
MTDEHLADAMSGLYAYDDGAVDSGIKDEVLKKRLFDRLHAMTEDEVRLFLGNFMREHFVGEEALEHGYGPEDLRSFIQWLTDNGYDL